MKLLATSLLLFLCLAFNAQNISVVTYNVNYALVNKKVVGYLDTINADVVCLQEVTKEWETILRNGLKTKYQHIEFKNSTASGGLAILSKYPILTINYLKNDTGWFRSALITIKKEQDTLQLLNVHLKPPLSNKGLIGWKASFKADQIHVAELKQFFKALNQELPTIILGDFNENDNKKGMKWLSNKHFTDALPLFDKRTKTWRFVFLRGRYDHIFFNQHFTCTKAKVYKLGRSDHFPVYGEFTLH